MSFFFKSHITINKPKKSLTFCQQKINKDVNQRQYWRFILFYFYKKYFKMRLSIGNDHAGTEHKKEIIDFLILKGHEVQNHGTDTTESVDYPDFIHPVAKDVASKNSDLGIIVCGSGNGAAMTANKHQNIRAALCWNKELAKLARQHNNANILSLPARFISIKETKDIVDHFLKTKFEEGRHKRRVDKIPCP